MKPIARTGWRLLAALVLTLVFALYGNPHLVVDMAGRLWSCI